MSVKSGLDSDRGYRVEIYIQEICTGMFRILIIHKSQTLKSTHYEYIFFLKSAARKNKKTNQK